MCGIVGYAGTDDALPFLIEGLKKLVYRGYDSFGFAINDKFGINCFRQLGQVVNYKPNTEVHPGTVGIAHTRWGTHGPVCLKNTHPIKGCRCAVVHNGTVENYQELKDYLEKSGLNFDTDTDTEVIVKLLDQQLEIIDWKTIETLKLDKLIIIRLAISNVLKKLKGLNAFAVISNLFPDLIVVTTSGPPIFVSEDGYIASDKVAMSGYTETVYKLGINDVVIVGKKFVNAKEQLQIETVPDLSDVSMGDFPHFMLKEIAEQPDILYRATQDRSLLGFPKPDKVFLFGCGSSYHAALIGRKFFEDVLIPTEVDYASELVHRNLNIQPHKTLYIAITQSGETRDTIEAVKHLPPANNEWPIKLAITNSPHSSIVKETGRIYQLNAGTEQGVAATKTFSFQVLGLLNIACMLNGGFINNQVLNELKDGIQQIWKDRKKIESFAKKVTHFHNVLFLGSGLYHAVALEGALKLKEVSYIHAEAIPSAEMKHGPIALIDENTLSIFILGNDNDGINDRTIANMHEIIARRGKVFAIVESGLYSKIKGITDYVFVYPNINQLFNPILANIPLQLLAYYVALQRNLNVDRPRNLAKSITV